MLESAPVYLDMLSARLQSMSTKIVKYESQRYYIDNSDLNPRPKLTSKHRTHVSV